MAVFVLMVDLELAQFLLEQLDSPSGHGPERQKGTVLS
jgi:hypothetical protein